MPKYKLIAADLDDTLLNDCLKVSPRNKKALLQAEDMGLIVTIATGRMFRSALPIALDLGVKGPIISYQGAFVKNVATGEVLVHRPVPFELALQVLAEGYKAGVHMNVYLDDTLYVDRITEAGKRYAEQAKVEMTPVGNLINFLKYEPTKILYSADPALLDKLQSELRKKFKDSLYITKSKPYYLEFMHPHATKMHGLGRMAEILGILPQEIIAFGDSYNDIEMIEFAGLGVAMGNSPPQIQAKADLVAGTNNSDGVAKVIEEYVLNKRV